MANNKGYNKQFNIPAWVKGDTMSDEAASINKKFKDRTSPDAQRTKEALLKSLAEKQEYVKMQEALKTQSQVIPDQMNGEVPEGMEQFSHGGFHPEQPGIDNIPGAGIDPSLATQPGQAPVGVNLSDQSQRKDWGDMSGAAKGASIVQGAGTALDLGMTAFGDPNVDMTGSQHIVPEKAGIGTASGALKGAAAGAQFGLIGAGVGLLAGGAAGLIGANKQKKAAGLANFRNTQRVSAGYGQSDFAYGGAVKQYQNGGFKQNPFSPNNVDINKTVQGYRDEASLAGRLSLTSPSIFGKPVGNVRDNIGQNTLPVSDYTGGIEAIGAGTATPGKTLAGRSLDWLGQNAGEMARFAPIAGNLMDLKNLKQAPTQRGSRLAGTYKQYRPDEMREMNQLNQFNTERALTEASGGDIGALRSNLLAAGAGKLKGKSAVMANIDKIKAAESAKAQQFGRQKDVTNLAAEERFLERAAKDKGAFETAKSGLKKAIYEDVGAVGKEAQDKEIVAKMFGYKWNAKYKKYEDTEGNLFSKEETQKKVDEKKKADKAEYDEFQEWRKNKTE